VVLQFVDESNVMVSVILHVRSDEAIGTEKHTNRNEPVSGM
jgi:hypothetical protein